MKTRTRPTPTPILMVVRDDSGEVIRRVRLDYSHSGHRDRVVQTIRWALAEGRTVGIKGADDE